jgi:hypothetical protein
MDYTDLPKTRAEAKATGAAYYFTGDPCKHGHIAPRKTKGACVECLKNEWKTNNEKRRDYFIFYNRIETIKDRKNAWYIANRDMVIQRATTRPAAQLREYRNNWKQNNLVKIRADTKARRRRHRQATPPWITRQQKTEMRQIYQTAITMTKITGEQYVVDHIVPLRSDIVCGLHVPWNLRIITNKENLAKSNKLVSDTDA